MQKLTLSFILLLIFTTAFPQEFSRQFGVISDVEKKLISYEKDIDAEAVVLFDIGESSFIDNDGGYNIRFTRTKRIKIFKQNGLEYAEVAIPFYVDGQGKTESVKSIKAFTYTNENGQWRKKALDQNTIFEEQINEKWRVKKFVFPSVQEGSIIEYQYVFETPFHFNLPDWTFQERIPVIYSKYTAKLIPFYEYVFNAQGIREFSYQKSEPSEKTRTFGTVVESYGKNLGNGFEYQEMIHTYVMEHVPAFKEESYITSPDDYIMKMEFQLARFHKPYGGTEEIVTTWLKLNESLINHDNFGKYIKKSKKYAKRILSSEINLTGKSDIEKSKEIISYVKTNFSWNGSNSKYASKTPKEFAQQKAGNCADINLFLKAILDAAGIKSEAVILSTRNHGKIKRNYPFANAFNYIILLVQTSNSLFLVDGTEDLLAFSRVPLRCINDRGLVVDEDEEKWLELENHTPSISNTIINMDIDPAKLEASTSISLQMTEFESYLYKYAFRNDTLKFKNKWQDDDFKNVSRINMLNYEYPTRPYTISFAADAPIEQLNDKLIISPFLNFPPKKNQLTLEKREYPVDLIYVKKENMKSLVAIPEGYKVLSLPEPYSLNNDLAEINLTIEQNKRIIEINGSYTFKKAVYAPEDYGKVKSYFDAIIKKFNEQVVLEKI